MVRAWFQFSPLVNVIISLCGNIAENNYKEKGLQILLYILNSNLPYHHPNTATIASLAPNYRLLTLVPPPFFLHNCRQCYLVVRPNKRHSLSTTNHRPSL